MEDPVMEGDNPISGRVEGVGIERLSARDLVTLTDMNGGISRRILGSGAEVLWWGIFSGSRSLVHGMETWLHLVAGGILSSV